jgi:hypothetical protein
MSLCFLSEEISLAAHKAEEVVEKVVNSLALLNDAHEHTIEAFVCHL